MQDVSSGPTGPHDQGQGRRSVPSASASHGKERESEMNDELVKKLLDAVIDLNKTVGDLKQTVGSLTASVEALNRRFDDQNENFKQLSLDIRQVRNWIFRGILTVITIVLTAAFAQYCGVSGKLETIRRLFPLQ